MYSLEVMQSGINHKTTSSEDFRSIPTHAVEKGEVLTSGTKDLQKCTEVRPDLPDTFRKFCTIYGVNGLHIRGSLYYQLNDWIKLDYS